MLKEGFSEGSDTILMKKTTEDAHDNHRFVDLNAMIIFDLYKGISVSCPYSVPESVRNRYIEEGIIKYGDSLKSVSIECNNEHGFIDIRYSIQIVKEKVAIRSCKRW